MSKKKIALFLFPTDRMGGAERVTKMLAHSAVDSRKFDEVICFILSKESTGTLDSLKCENKARVVYTGARSEIRGLPHLLKQLIESDYSLVFSSHSHLNAAVSLFRKLGLLRTTQLVTRESTLIFERDLGLKGRLVKFFYRLYGEQDLIICQTERMAQSLSANTAGRFDKISETVPNPVDLTAIKISMDRGIFKTDWIPAGSCAIGWCGRLSAVKSPLRALDTLSILLERGNSDFHLVIIGDGPLRAEVEKHVKRIGLENKVTMVGYHPDPVAVLKYCELGLMTSDIEGFPNVILEMLASGVKAVVSTNCAGGLKSIPGVFVSESTAPEALALVIEDARRRGISPDVQGFLNERRPQAFLKKICDGKF